MQPKNPVTLGILSFCVLFIVIVVFVVYKSTTATESALSALLLTLISIVATWIVADLYANYTRKQEIENLNEAHEKSLRMYALKAAEKVMNLSKELDRLSEFLVEYRDAEDHPNLEVTLRIKEERVTGAIHIVNILKSVNDTTLSDWQGVIGDELSRKKEGGLKRKNT